MGRQAYAEWHRTRGRLEGPRAFQAEALDAPCLSSGSGAGMSRIGAFALAPNSLYYGDCLEVMQAWPDAQVDLIYLDPPFNSKTDYNILFGTENGVPAQVRAFTDTWTWNEAAAARYATLSRAMAHPAYGVVCGLHQILGESGMLSYLTYMAQRLAECKRMLKPAGSLYLHCDPTASHYLKALMDAIFGPQHFRNEIVWRIGWVSGFKTQKRGWIRNHDTILYYLRTAAAAKRFNKEYIPYRKGYLRRDGKEPTGKGIPIEDTWNCSSADVLDSIMIKSFSTEKLGYDTQKPLALLERIIKASSHEGDLVLDPFCGCGTTLAAASNLNRRWVGIDISPFAVRLVRDVRLKDVRLPIHGIPADMKGARELLRHNPFHFEAWIVMSIEGLAANEVQVGDGGIDGRGRMYTVPDGETGLVLAQVKGGGYTASALRDFEGTMARVKATAGIFVTLERVKNSRARAAAQEKGTYTVGASRYPRLQFWSAQEYLDGVRPNLPAMADPYTGEAVQIDMFTQR